MPNNTAAPHPLIGVGAVILDDIHRILLIKRGKEPAIGQWSIPGGTLEAGETLVDACRREVFEETGIRINLGPIIAVVERQHPGFYYLIIDFAATLADSNEQKPQASSDAAEACWISLSELANYNLVDGLLAVIEKAQLSVNAERSIGLYDVNGKATDFLP